jgi:hypothetical protein
MVIKRKPRSKPSAPPAMPFVGDHGTGTAAANFGTVIVPIMDDDGRNPNTQGPRRRVHRLSEIDMTMRQQQAGEAIELAFCRVQMLSSGGELKARVDSSPKPDHAASAQVDAHSRLVVVMAAVPALARGIVEHVCWHNQPINSFRPVGLRAGHSARLKAALDLVADRLEY